MVEKYVPSNGTEGMGFIESHCCQCVYEKFMHTQDHSDKKCDIFSRTLLYDVKEKEYPEEWTYDEKGNPVCTEFKKFDWDKGDDGNWIDPPPKPIDDPNQLCMPFIFDEIGIPKNIEINV